MKPYISIIHLQLLAIDVESCLIYTPCTPHPISEVPSLCCYFPQLPSNFSFSNLFIQIEIQIKSLSCNWLLGLLSLVINCFSLTSIKSYSDKVSTDWPAAHSVSATYTSESSTCKPWAADDWVPWGQDPCPHSSHIFPATVSARAPWHCEHREPSFPRTGTWRAGSWWHSPQQKGLHCRYCWLKTQAKEKH